MLLQRPVDVLEHVHVAGAVLPLLRRYLEVRVVIAVVLREVVDVLQVEVLVGLVLELEAFSEDALHPTLQDLPVGELVPHCEHEDDDREVESHAVLVVWVDVLLGKGGSVVGFLHRDEHDQQVEEAHEQWVELQLAHH